MTMMAILIGAARFAVVLTVAVFAGVAVTFASALLGHAILVRIYGENLAPIDDTLPMITVVACSYIAGMATGLLVLMRGWRRFVRRPRPSSGPIGRGEALTGGNSTPRCR